MKPVQVTLPDGSRREAPAGTSSRQIAADIGPGLARAALAAQVNGEIWDLDRPLEADASLAILTERDPEALSCCGIPRPTSWPPRCGSSSPMPASASVRPSRTGSTTTSRWTGRSRPRTSSGSKPRWREVAARDFPFVREVVDRAEAQAPLRRRSAQARADRRAGRRRDHHGLHRRSVRRSLPRAPHPADRAAQALQAAACRRRLLAGRREAADAAADLRHGVVQEGGPRCLPAPAGGGPPPRPPRAGQAARSFLDPGDGRARAGLLASQGGHDQVAADPRRRGRQPPERLRPGVHAQHHPRGAVQDLGPPSAVRGQPVSADGGGSRGGGGRALPGQADELPDARADL